MVILVVSARDVPLAARYPASVDRLAVHAMLVAQIAASAVLFPWLLRDAMTTLLVAAAGAAFLTVAAYVAGGSHARALLAVGYMIGWLIGLALWRDVLARRRAIMVGVAFAACLALGGVILAYLRAEASTGSDHTPSHHFGPILGGLSQLYGPSRQGWIFLAAFVLIALLAHQLDRRR
jgi:hypothetical protein